jgi:hypothetical protein
MTQKVCYQVHSHRAPGQVERLVRRLTGGTRGGVVLVSHDVRGEPLPVRRLERLGDVHVLPAEGGYGDFGHVDRWVDAVRWLTAHGVSYDWMVTVSGQDYPLRPVALIERELASAGVDGFLESFPVFGAESHWPMRRARSRYLYRHRRLGAYAGRGPVRAALRVARGVNLVQPLVRVNAAYGTVGARTRTPLGPSFPLYGGSFWVTLRRRCVEHVVSCYETQPDVVAYFRGTLAPEEVFFQTVLRAAGTFTFDPDPRRYFDFSGDRARPRVLGLADLPALRASNAHFARKFDESQDRSVLDALDTATAAAT